MPEEELTLLSGETFLVFADRATADEVMLEIASTPFGQIWLWFDPIEPTNQVTVVEGADGRCFIAHWFSEEDRDWVEGYLFPWIEAELVGILDKLPDDWAYPE